MPSRRESRPLARIGKKRIRFTDPERRRLTATGRPLGRKLLGQVAALVTPDTILSWHRALIAKKWTYGTKGTGRPPTAKKVEDLIVKMAKDNPRSVYPPDSGCPLQPAP